MNINIKNHPIIYYNDNKSFWHDIPTKLLHSTDILNFVVEIPDNTIEKMEVSKEMENNPIVIDRLYKNPIPFTYGCIPRTYEDPYTLDPLLNIYGDNDPLDACEISNLIYDTLLTEDNHTKFKTGDVKHVVVLGMLSIIDLKKADWKLIVIDINTYRKCLKILNLSKKDIFNNHVKMIIKEWYDLDPKSVVGSYYDDFVIINKIIDHSIHSYNKVMKYKTQ